MILCHLAIAPHLIQQFHILRELRAKIHLDRTFNLGIAVELEKHDKIDVRTTRRIHKRQSLNTHDRTAVGVSLDRQHFQDFLVVLDARHNIVQDRQEILLVFGLLVDVGHITDHGGILVGSLNDIHILVDVGLRTMRHQDSDLLAELFPQNVSQSRRFS